MNIEQDLIFEAYAETLTEDWQKGTSKAPKGKSFDMSRGGAPSGVDAASDGSGGRYRKTRPPSAQSKKTHGEMEEEDEINENEEDQTKNIAKALQEIVAELKTLNQYADFISTGTRTQGFAGDVKR